MTLSPPIFDSLALDSFERITSSAPSIKPAYIDINATTDENGV